jgi:hypothetical protein
LGPASPSESSGRTPSDIVVGEFNGDGTADLATANRGIRPPGHGGVRVFPGNGDGTFQPARATPWIDASALTTGDFNGDGKGDRKKEADETFYQNLFDPSGLTVFTKKRGIGTIQNDD